jgi:hypothetical protein
MHKGCEAPSAIWNSPHALNAIHTLFHMRQICRKVAAQFNLKGENNDPDDVFLNFQQ